MLTLRYGAAALAAALLISGCAADEPLPRIARTAAMLEPIAVADPERIVIEAINLDASMVELGLNDDGSMETPEFNSNLAGWYIEGPKPGASGPAVIAAHVDQPGGGGDTFARLDELEAGDEIVVIDVEGVEYTFTVDRTAQADKDQLPYEEIWPVTDETLLTLITCDGPYLDGEYEDNLIVYAESR